MIGVGETDHGARYRLGGGNCSLDADQPAFLALGAPRILRTLKSLEFQGASWFLL